MENNFWKNRIDDTIELSGKLNVDEEKIKELKEGKRIIEGETLERTLNKINQQTPAEKKMNDVKIFDWYMRTDLKLLRLKFGFAHQHELAKEVGIAQSTICHLERKKVKKMTKSIKKLYYFFNNDFNKKLDTEVETNEKQEEINYEIKPLDEKVEPVDDSEIIKLKSEITRLKSQILRYEKLIDLI